MITKAAVIIFDKRQQKYVTMPVHRHCDAFYILKELNYRPNEYTVAAQGFLDEHDKFYNRVDAKKHAQECKQIEETEFNELFSEDLW